MTSNRTVPAVNITLFGVMLLWFGLAGVKSYTPNPDIGYPAGFLPDCPGTTKNASISPRMVPQLQVIIHRWTPSGSTAQSLPVNKAHKVIANDKYIDLKKKKTLLYAVGYLDSSIHLHSQAIANSYAKKGYNVFVTETFTFLSYIYPKSVRLTRPIGKKLGDFLIKLTELGMEAENLELVGFSLGGHIVSFAAKHFYSVTGKKPSRITGVDPAGPCFRSMSPQYRLDSTDADRVDVIHTNIDGFGIAERLGHVDFYVNGGEYQPGDIEFLPCLVICSHIKAIIYFWQAIEHSKMFIGIKCDSIQDARLANCYNNTQTNYLGFETNFDRPGIYYLGTHNSFPYYRGKDGLKPENEVYTSIIRSINSDDMLVVKK